MTERISQPKNAVVVDSYAEFDRYVSAFSEGHLNLLIVIGRAGTSKSQSVRKAVGDSVCWIEGNASAFGIYCDLYRHRDQLVVIDDVDSLYSNKAAVRLLKCLCQTDERKSVAWHTNAVGQSDEDIPTSFETTSRVCIIANDWKSLSQNTAAVEDRGHTVVFDPTPEEVHRKVAEWFDDQEVFDWFADFLHMIPNVSMRQYVRASELKKAGIDWVKTVLTDEIPEKAMLVAKLKADPHFREERDRVKAFAEQGGGGKTTWYKWSKRVTSPMAKSLRIDLAEVQGRGSNVPGPTRLRVVRELAG
ncbi:hypothetical protein [Crateriforma conspicua]|uniref:AAA+ ATPase domain-containing protein n=1 Tax=Crateriforma conspicua TaxID=2527996 RepID=A0A5C6FFU3_9PLAN|nr:hypothetical protein [Crateriforma conspicua]TWU59637.1 hypothetical protein V7x_55470 [Crateriforma conspicua]